MIDKRPRIAVDLDGTLTKKGYFNDIYHINYKTLGNQYSKAKPDKEMIKIINDYHKKGYIIYIFTSRSDLHERITKKWLDKYKVKYHYIIMNKPFYNLIIDDKAVRPEEVKLWNGQTRKK